jgi:hypothetical protein
MGLLTSNFGNRIILVSAGTFGTLGFFWTLMFVKFPINRPPNHKENKLSTISSE